METISFGDGDLFDSVFGQEAISYLTRDQFVEMRQADRFKEGEMMLILAVLEEARHLLLVPIRGEPYRRAFWETVGWYRRNDRQWPFSFNTVCEALKLEPSAVRKALQAIAEKNPVYKNKPIPKSNRRGGPKRVAA